MSEQEQPEKSPTKAKLGVWLKPMNLVKTIASQIPFASAAVEMANQIDGFDIQQRIESLEDDAQSAKELRALEDANPKTPAPLHDWSISAGEYIQRIVDIAVVYDGGFHSRPDTGRELYQAVAHACNIGNGEILVCREAMEVAKAVAEHKDGKVIFVIGQAWYDFESVPVVNVSGLSVCRLTERDEKRWRQSEESWRRHGLGELKQDLISTQVRFAVSPWMGQEIGFVHSGEAQDVMRGSNSLTKLQFDTTTVSHFRRPSADGLKTFVTGVLPGRVVRVGSPVFGRDGTLLGVLSDTESYDSDAGRRAVCRSLLGHPRFMGTAEKEGKHAFA
jgi:hypothetical protein